MKRLCASSCLMLSNAALATEPPACGELSSGTLVVGDQVLSPPTTLVATDGDVLVDGQSARAQLERIHQAGGWSTIGDTHHAASQAMMLAILDGVARGTDLEQVNRDAEAAIRAIDRSHQAFVNLSEPAPGKIGGNGHIAWAEDQDGACRSIEHEGLCLTAVMFPT